MSGIGEEAEARGLHLNDVGDPERTSPRTVNQSWLKPQTVSFDDLVGAGQGGAADRGRNAAAYAVSEIPRLRGRR